MEEIKLGNRVHDRITGFEGIVTGIADYLHNNRRILVEAEELDGGEPKTVWFEIERLKLTRMQPDWL